jgi:hypothetical protein
MVEPSHWTISFLSIEPTLNFHRMVGLEISAGRTLLGLEMEVDRQSTPGRLISRISALFGGQCSNRDEVHHQIIIVCDARDPCRDATGPSPGLIGRGL